MLFFDNKIMEMLNNCAENGYSFSCFKHFGVLKSSVDCKKECEANHLTQFGINDFYNFAERLNESNFETKLRTTEPRRLRPIYYICTQIKFDFPTRTWMDKTASLTNDFENKWRNKKGFLDDKNQKACVLR